MKKLKESPYVGFGVGFLAGFIVSKNILAAALVGFVSIAVQAVLISKFRLIDDTNPKDGFLKKEQDYLKNILVLAGFIIKADGKEGVKEIGFVEHQLRKNFSPQFVPVAMSHLRAELRKSSSLKTHTAELAMNFDNTAKIQLMSFLVTICAADGLMSDAERKVLFEISAQIEFAPQTLEAIIGRYRFSTEQRGKQQYQQQTKPASSGKLDDAYKVLQIPAGSSNEQIKKAYKKLAILHHPDKAAHLGEHVQKNAAEKFKAVVSAYDLICKKRGIF